MYSDMHKDLCRGSSGLCDAMRPTKGADLLKYLRKVNFTGTCLYWWMERGRAKAKEDKTTVKSCAREERKREKGETNNRWVKKRGNLYTFEAVALFSLFMPRCKRTVERTNEQGRKISGTDSTLFGKQYIMIVNFATHTHRVCGQWIRACTTKVKEKRVCFTM